MEQWFCITNIKYVFSQICGAVQHKISILKPNLLKSRLPITYFLVAQFCAEHSSDTMYCAKFQNDWTTETYAMDELDFMRFVFKDEFQTNILYCMSTLYTDNCLTMILWF